MKTILISGGSDGLGKAMAAQLAQNHKVIILAQDAEKLQKAAEELGCDYQVCDVRDNAQIEQAAQKVGAIDCLINNAGLWIQGPLEENDPQYIQKVLEVNTLGTINLTRAVLPAMKQQGSGLIINVISQGGLHAKANHSVYAASKWAITGFTKALQAELSPAGIGVTGLYPGKLKTDFFAKAGIEKNMSNGLDVAAVAKTVEFIVEADSPAVFPEVGIKHIDQ